MIKSYEQLVKEKRMTMQEKIRDEENRIIHQVLSEINITPERPFYAYFCSVGDFEIMHFRLDKHHWLKFSCGLRRTSKMGETYFDTRILEHDFGEDFAHALRENYKKIVERIKRLK